MDESDFGGTEFNRSDDRILQEVAESGKYDWFEARTGPYGLKQDWIAVLDVETESEVEE